MDPRRRARSTPPSTAHARRDVGLEHRERLRRDIAFLDEAYPEVTTALVVIEGAFGPELIQELSKEWHIPTNFMFIGSPGDGFYVGLADLGGVRLII